jgi:transposase
MRLHAAFGPDGTPRALRLTAADRPERDVALELLPAALHGGEIVIADKGYAGRQFAAAVTAIGASVVRPPRVDEPDSGPRIAPIRQRIESIFWTAKDLLTLERHGARTLRNLRARILQRLLALTASVYLNHWLGRPSRALVDYVA